MKKHDKPRVRFCWHCGRQLWGRHHKKILVDGNETIVHEGCVKRIDLPKGLVEEMWLSGERTINDRK